MSSQESEERKTENGGQGGNEREGVEVDEASSASIPERSVDGPDSSRIGPWTQPDFSRQTALAERLSNPTLRTKRPPGSQQSHASDRRRPYTPLTASLATIHNPYAPGSSRIRASYTPGSRMSSAASAPAGSPRRDGSPRRQLSTPRYGSLSPRRQPPLFPTPSNTRKVSEQELDIIVARVTRPTVASRGGVDLLDKDFTYIKPRRLKTLPVVPGLERRYLGLKVVDSGRMQEIVDRLTRMTSAYTAKFAPNRNVWIDMEPGAHMVQQRNAQSV